MSTNTTRWRPGRQVQPPSTFLQRGTILLKKKELPEWVTLGSEYVGIRVPDLKVITSIINNFGKPILAPSANRSGEKPALTSKEVEVIFGNELGYIVCGNASNDIASTIIKIDGGVQILRQKNN